MKVFTFIMFIYLFLSNVTDAQDIIIMKNGDEISSKVLEISNSEIKYKKYSFQEGPIYSIQRNEVFMIKYESGVKDLFNTEKDRNMNMANNADSTVSDLIQKENFSEKSISDNSIANEKKQIDIEYGFGKSFYIKTQGNKNWTPISRWEFEEILQKGNMSAYHKYKSGNSLAVMGGALCIPSFMVWGYTVVATTLPNTLWGVSTAGFITGWVIQKVGRGQMNKAVKTFNSSKDLSFDFKLSEKGEMGLVISF